MVGKGHGRSISRREAGSGRDAEVDYGYGTRLLYDHCGHHHGHKESYDHDPSDHAHSEASRGRPSHDPEISTASDHGILLGILFHRYRVSNHVDHWAWELVLPRIAVPEHTSFAGQALRAADLEYLAYLRLQQQSRSGPRPESCQMAHLAQPAP